MQRETAFSCLHDVIFPLTLHVEEAGTFRGRKAQPAGGVGDLGIAVGAQADGNSEKESAHAGKIEFQPFIELLEYAQRDVCSAQGQRFEHMRKVEIFGDDDPQLSRLRVEEFDARPAAVFAAVDPVDHVRDAQNPISA